jgi:hypothetical protein
MAAMKTRLRNRPVQKAGLFQSDIPQCGERSVTMKIRYLQQNAYSFVAPENYSTGRLNQAFVP